MTQPSDEIKSKLDIVDVIREYIPLKAAGVNFRALCPFHREKSPSFVVSPEKQIWHCFGCGKGGDLFSFVMEKEGMNFVEVLRMLAPKAGVVLKRQDPKATSQRNRLLDILELSSKYYHKILLEGEAAVKAREYLTERGLTSETIEEWQIGYSPDSWDDLLIFLRGKGYNEQEIFSTGMIVKKEGAQRFYNRFRGRIMFPIRDVNGSVAAFSARVSPEKEESEKMGKYINSPQTLIYDKSKILFALDKARQAIRGRDLAVVVEGQMDAITAHQHGFANVVASSGTSLTTEQVAMLKRYTNNIALAFDMDAAGEMAAERGAEEAMRVGMNIKVITLTSGKDPDECIKSSPAEWEKAVQGAKQMMQYYFDKTFVNLDLSQVEDKRKAAAKLLPILAQLSNKIDQDFWLRKLSESIDIQEPSLREEMTKLNLTADQKYKEPTEDKRAEAPAPASVSREDMLSQLLLVIVLKFPQFAEYAINRLQPDQVVGLENQFLYRQLIIYYNKLQEEQSRAGKAESPLITYENFKSWLARLEEYNGDETKAANQLRLLDKLIILGDRDFYDYDDVQAKNEIIKAIIALKRYYLVSRKKEVEKLIAQAEQEKNEEAIGGLMEEFRMLTEELREVGE